MTSAVAEVEEAVGAEATDQRHGDVPYHFAVVPLKHMIVDAYQRPLTTFVERIEKKFDPALVGTLCLSQRSKTKFAIIDGQTRAEGMKRIGLKDAPCIVYTNLSPQREADLFAKLQTERRGMTSASRFNAEVYAGKEPMVSINKVVKAEGFVVDANLNTGGPEIRAVAALEYVFAGATGQRKAKRTERHPELLAQTLRVLRSAWPKLPDTAKGAVMIRGLGHFLHTHPEVQEDRLIVRLSKVTPSDLGKRAEALREGRGMSASSPVNMSEAIEAIYRKGR